MNGSSKGVGDYIQDFTVTWTPEPARAALVLVDLQVATGARSGPLGRKLADRPELQAARFDRIEQVVTPNVARLLAAFRGAGRRVVHIANTPRLPDASDAPPHMRALFVSTGNHLGSPSSAFLDVATPVADEVVVHKCTVGAFASSTLDQVLRSLDVRQLYVAGVSTNMCVDTTAREAADRGYRVNLIGDACGASRDDFHEMALVNFERLFGRVVDTDRAIAEIAGEAAVAAG